MFNCFLKKKVDWVDGIIIAGDGGDGGLLVEEEVERLIGHLF